MGGVVFFSATDGVFGRELWKSDGTDGGTVMVRDINTGSEGSEACCLFPGGGMLYFRASDGFSGAELWRSDGIEGGTFQVRDINVGTPSSDPLPFARLGGAVLVVADDGMNGRELWRSDGTDGGTVFVRDINPGPFSAFPVLEPEDIELHPEVAVWESEEIVYFPANDGAIGIELWGTDGTEAGTRLIRELNPFGDSVDDLAVVWRTRSMATLGGAIFANATNGSFGRTLWVFERR
jgi:ELWxxDGT repeat protein